MVDDAVRATLEMESYTKPAVSGISPVSEKPEDNTSGAAAAVTQKPSDLKLVLERMDQMEAQLKELQLPMSCSSDQSRGRGRTPQMWSRNCWNCGGEAHLSRVCPSRKTPRSSPGNRQGNGKPLTL